MPRERMRDLELPAYMRALVEAREKWMDESSGRLNEHIEHLEWIDELAVALGISVDAEDWWDSTVPAKRTKIMGRISVLRSLRSAPETGVRCTCKDYPGADQFCTAHKVRPAHTAAHDCACAECVKAETQTEDDGARRARLGLCLAETADGRDMKRCAAFPECLCGGPSGNR